MFVGFFNVYEYLSQCVKVGGERLEQVDELHENINLPRTELRTS